MTTHRTALLVASLLCLPACADDDPAGPAPEGAPAGVADSGEADGSGGADCSEDNVLQIRYLGPEDSVYDPDAFVAVQDGDTLKAVEDVDGRAKLYLNLRVSESQERMEHEIVLYRDGVAIGWIAQAGISLENGVDQFNSCFYSGSTRIGLREMEERDGHLPALDTTAVLNGPVDIEMTIVGTLTGDEFTTSVRDVTLVELNQ
jgi:hypothetical protein